MSDDPDEYVAEPTDPLFDLVLKFEGEFTELANKLDIPNDELKRVADVMDKGHLGSVFAYFLRNTVGTRRLSALCSLMLPGEECVTLRELVEREARTKGSA